MTPPTRDLQKTAFSGFEEKFRKLTVIRQRVVFLILEPIVLDPNVIKIESDPGKICAKFFYGFTVWDLSQWTFPVEGPPFDLHDIISPPIALFRWNVALLTRLSTTTRYAVNVWSGEKYIEWRKRVNFNVVRIWGQMPEKYYGRTRDLDSYPAHLRIVVFLVLEIYWGRY